MPALMLLTRVSFVKLCTCCLANVIVFRRQSLKTNDLYLSCAWTCGASFPASQSRTHAPTLMEWGDYFDNAFLSAIPQTLVAACYRYSNTWLLVMHSTFPFLFLNFACVSFTEEFKRCTLSLMRQAANAGYIFGSALFLVCIIFCQLSKFF